jgi:hypothetical protein
LDICGWNVFIKGDAFFLLIELLQCKMYVTINIHKIVNSLYCGFVVQIKIAWKDYYDSLSLDEEPKMRGEVEQQLGSTWRANGKK